MKQIRVENPTYRLHLAITRGSAREVNLVLSDIVNSVNEEGQPALHVAAEKGNFEIVQLLLSKGALVDSRDRDGRTPLFSAILAPPELASPTLRVLLEAGANPNVSDSEGLTPLHYALAPGGELGEKSPLSGCIRTLLEWGADPSAVEKSDEASPLHYICMVADTDENVELCRIMCQKMVDWDHRPVCSKILGLPSHVACVEARLRTFQTLVHFFPELVNKPDKRGQSPLMAALEWGGSCYFSSDRLMMLVRFLIDSGCDLEHVDDNGQTPLYLACALEGCLKCPDLIETLVQHGADFRKQVALKEDGVKESLITTILHEKQDKSQWLHVVEFLLWIGAECPAVRYLRGQDHRSIVSFACFHQLIELLHPVVPGHRLEKTLQHWFGCREKLMAPLRHLTYPVCSELLGIASEFEDAVQSGGRIGHGDPREVVVGFLRCSWKQYFFPIVWKHAHSRVYQIAFDGLLSDIDDRRKHVPIDICLLVAEFTFGLTFSDFHGSENDDDASISTSRPSCSIPTVVDNDEESSNESSDEENLEFETSSFTSRRTSSQLSFRSSQGPTYSESPAPDHTNFHVDPDWNEDNQREVGETSVVRRPRLRGAILRRSNRFSQPI